MKPLEKIVRLEIVKSLSGQINHNLEEQIIPHFSRDMYNWRRFETPIKLRLTVPYRSLLPYLNAVIFLWMIVIVSWCVWHRLHHNRSFLSWNILERIIETMDIV